MEEEMSSRRINLYNDDNNEPAGTFQELDTRKIPQKFHKTNIFHKYQLFIGSILFGIIFIIIIIIASILLHNQVNEIIWDHRKLPIEQSIWYDKGMDEIRSALNVVLNTKPAKNVILFVGDGMGPNTVTASRIYGFQEDGLLSWEKFPHMGLLKTYSHNKQVPDSFSSATALFGGVKTNFETGGVDSSISLGNCSASLDPRHHVETILKWAQDAGMNTGFVTTTRVTHATPAALYANVPDRRWECEAKMPQIALHEGCIDIGKILIESEVGQKINVIMGGGRQCLVSDVKGSKLDPIDTWACYSKDGRNLIKDWEMDKLKKGLSYAVLSNNSDLNNFNILNTDYVLGIFSNGHLKYDHERDKGPAGMPSLTEMTLKALDLLKSKKTGFLLVVEGGMIDQAHHRGTAKKALSETLALHLAVEKTLEIFKENLSETMIIVTADHSHTLTLNGYPERGNNVFGIASKSRTDQIPYTFLTYGTGNAGYQVEIDETNGNGKAHRKDPSNEDITSFEYVQQSAIKTDENTHGGSDVTVHAIGPMAHLFHRVHENSYVAHVISYALRIGRFRDSSIFESVTNS